MSESIKLPKLSQTTRVLLYLQNGKTLTQAQARNWGISSPSSRVNELRRRGVPITSVPMRHRTTGRTVVRYKMAV